MSGKHLPLLKARLFVPPLEEAAKVLENGLKENFASVEVRVVDCPDLTQKPFMLASPDENQNESLLHQVRDNLSRNGGLCGSPRLADVGGVPYLLPLAKLEKQYNVEVVAEMVELPHGTLMGAGAGPNHVIGVNCEMVCNFKAGDGKKNQTYFFKVNQQDNGAIQCDVKSSEFCLMANLFCSDGKPGKVIEAKASRRIGPDNFMSCLRKTLSTHYGTKAVGLGGTFLLGKGKAKLHVMPAFSKIPLTCDADVDNWLNFYEMSAPLVCVGEVISHDPELDLRVEHFHCFSDHGEGGHYHCDTTPEEAEYLGYFNLAEYMYRIDKPLETHNIGRD